MRNFTFAAALAGAAALLVIPTAAQAKSRHHHNGHSSVRVGVYPQYGYGYANYGGYGGYQPAYYNNGYQPYYGSQRYYGQPYYGYRRPRGHRNSHYGVSKHQRKHMRRNSRHH